MGFKKKIYLVLAIFGLTTLVLIVFLIYPIFIDIKRASQEVVSSREKTAFLYIQNQELDNFEKSFKVYEANLSKAEKLFIDPKNPVDFVRFLEQTSSSLSLELDINLIQGKEKEQPNNSQLSSFQIYATGDFENILEFTEKIENGPYLLQIDKLTLDSDGANFLVQVVNKQL